MKQVRPEDIDFRVKYLTVALVLFAVAIGICAVFVSFVTRSVSDIWDTPQQLPLVHSIFLGGAGAMATTIMVMPIVYWLNQRLTYPSSLIWWIIIGLFFSIFSALISGALYPYFLGLVGVANSVININNVLGDTWIIILTALLNGIRNGASDIYVWMIFGVIFGVAGWIIDNISALGVAKSGSFYAVLVSLVLGIFIMLFIFFTPLETFAKFGLSSGF